VTEIANKDIIEFHGRNLAIASAPFLSASRTMTNRSKRLRGKEGLKMNIEIHKPDLVRRLTMRIRTGQFHDADELIEKALDALDVHTAGPAPTTETGAVVLAALQASPYPEIDLTPPRVRLSNIRDVVL
jgi:hypothetical protein